MAENKEPSMGLQLGGAVASGVANTAIGQGLNLIFGKQQDKRQLKQQKKLNALQIAGSKELSDYSQALQLDTWNKTSYGAQKSQMEKAGLNPALMYGMSGGGGVTTGSGGATAVQGATAGDPNAGVGMGIQMGQQVAMMQAQIENIKADTRNKEANTTNTGANTNVQNATVGQINETIENLKSKTQQQDAITNLTKLQTDLGEIQKRIQLATEPEQISQIEEANKNMIEIVKQSKIKTHIDQATENELIKKVKLENIETMLNNKLIQSKTGLTNQETKAVINEVMQKWDGINNQGIDIINKYLKSQGKDELQGDALKAATKLLTM